MRGCSEVVLRGPGLRWGPVALAYLVEVEANKVSPSFSNWFVFAHTFSHPVIITAYFCKKLLIDNVFRVSMLCL